MQTLFEMLPFTPKLPNLLDLTLYSYLFILILIFNIQDTRILLRHGASVFYLQFWACAGFFLGLLPPAYSGMLWYNIVQVSLLLCLEKRSRFHLLQRHPLILYCFSAQRCNQSRNRTNETKKPHTLNAASKRYVFPNPDTPKKQKIHFKTIPGIMQQYKQYSDSS